VLVFLLSSGLTLLESTIFLAIISEQGHLTFQKKKKRIFIIGLLLTDKINEIIHISLKMSQFQSVQLTKVTNHILQLCKENRADKITMEIFIIDQEIFISQLKIKILLNILKVKINSLSFIDYS